MENKAEERLRIMDVIKNNATTVISIGAFVWILFSYVILPIQKMQFQITNILDNHLATIQTEMIEAKAERDFQGKQLNTLSEQIIRLQVIMENK